MTTVQVTGANYQPSLVSVVVGWLRSDVLVVPHSSIYPPNQTEQQAEQENAEEFASSQDSAKTAALTELGYPVGTELIVSSVVAGSPAEGKLHAGDVIKAVDGAAVQQPTDVAKLVTKHKPGQQVVFSVVGAKDAAAADKAKKQPGPAKDVALTTAKASDDKRAIVGIQAGVEHTFPFTIDIKLADVSGPSAGLMFSLGIVDKLTPGNLNGGKFVAGTGTIDDSGNVGPIGGISMKMITARDQGARFFLTPKDNCATAAGSTPSGLRLVKVNNINDAIGALNKISHGDTASLPKCSKG
jgi:PDZ domain-containing protein